MIEEQKFVVYFSTIAFFDRDLNLDILMQAPSESPISDIASINSPAPKRAANTKGKRKVNPVEDDDVEEGEEDGRKRKRNRMSLSCKKCKSRKVKVSISMSLEFEINIRIQAN